MNFIHDDVGNDVDDDAKHDDIYVIHDTIHNMSLLSCCMVASSSFSNISKKFVALE
jgi:hypothetical protein